MERNLQMHRIQDLLKDAGIQEPLSLEGHPIRPGQHHRVNILALGDVGMTMLIGLRLLGSDVISKIGICDIRPETCERLVREINQIRYPDGKPALPPVRIVGEDTLFDTDVLIFCASRGVPALGQEKDPGFDVRMAQLDANRDIIRHYAALARDADYKGLIAVVSDPVDNLCAAFLDESGLHPSQFRGFGLGVMNARAAYYADQDERFAMYAREGRAFGPHGSDLVIANSIEHYDDELSRELTEKAVNANIEVRELGFKPYIAPALSSAAISVILTLKGEWSYGSLYLGDKSKGAFLGIRSRFNGDKWDYEDPELPDKLYERIRDSYIRLCRIR